ncbi:MAG: Mu transposase domain-containing protein [Acidimicrobiales bacterium]
MLTQGEDVEAHALKERGWSISAIARHLERDRKTVRSYLNGDRHPGVRVTVALDPLADFEGYIRARFVDDPHLWATSLFVEVTALGYERSYPTFVRQLRQRALRPHCEACRGVKGRDTIEIEHPPGEEIQWDWFERRRAPWGGTAYVLLGTLPHSSRTRGVLAESLDQAHLVEAMDAVMRKLGGTARVWRTDRLATVIVPGSRDVQPSFAPVAKHYGAIVEPCPPRRGNRKGAVEAAVRFTCGRWWRTMTATTPEEAQLSLDRFLAGAGDARERRAATGARTTVGALGDTEPLLPLPALAFPATIEVTRVVAANATVAFRGNRYAVPPGLTDLSVQLRHRLSSPTVEIHSPVGGLLAAHRLAPAGAGTIVRSAEQHAALERAVLSAFTTNRPCDRKANRPPGPDAINEAARLLGNEGRAVVVDLAAYALLVEGSAS